MKVSGPCAISATKLIVLERTDFVAKLGPGRSLHGDDLGTWTSPSPALNYLGSLNADGALQVAGITPLRKTLVIDLDTINPAIAQALEHHAVEELLQRRHEVTRRHPVQVEAAAAPRPPAGLSGAVPSGLARPGSRRPLSIPAYLG